MLYIGLALSFNSEEPLKTRTNVSKSRVIKVLSSPEEEQEEEEQEEEEEEEEQRGALLEPALAMRRG